MANSPFGSFSFTLESINTQYMKFYDLEASC